jgi:hypothetical protein
MAKSCKILGASLRSTLLANAKQPTAVSPPSPQPVTMAPAVQPKKRSQKARSQNIIDEAQPQNVELRFSFTSPQDGTPDREKRDSTFSQSFSGLSVSASGNRSFSGNQSQAKAPAVRSVQSMQSLRPNPFVPKLPQYPSSQPPQPQPPALSKPHKKREGYGFSYSETFMYDSDEYPDTECGSDDEEASTQLQTEHAANHNAFSSWNGTDRTSRPVSRDSATTVEDRSFNDLLVLRDVGSFHLARPQRTLPCTRATREDTVRLKDLAIALMDKRPESEDIQAALLGRLERMVHNEQQGSFTGTDTSISHCALKLRNFLLKVKEERIETGELRSTVEHEIEWVKWLVEASRTGVMHVRTEDCTCRPEWEEE